MTTYTITVYNQSSAVQNFLLFSSPPTKPTQVGIWSNVWIKSPGVGTPHGDTKFTITTDLFAVCGIGSQALADGVGVETSDFSPVTLTTSSASGTKVTVEVVDDGAVISPTTSTTTTQGCYAIDTLPFNAVNYRMSILSMSPNLYIDSGVS
jgi:hypothetical protein